MKSVKYQNDPAIVIKEWVNAYSDKIYSWCLYKTSSRKIAEDLVQDTFMATFQSIKKYEGKSDPKTWLFSILNNKIANHFRKLYHNPTITEGKIVQSSEASIFETSFDDNGSWLKEQRPQAWLGEDVSLPDYITFLKVLQSCRSKLSPDCYSAVQLKYLEEKKEK